MTTARQFVTTGAVPRATRKANGAKALERSKANLAKIQSLAEEWEKDPGKPAEAINASTQYDAMAKGEYSLAEDWEKGDTGEPVERANTSQAKPLPKGHKDSLAEDWEQ